MVGQKGNAEMNKRVCFVLGLRGIGKTRYIETNMQTWSRLDIATFWGSEQLRGMSRYEAATWTKGMMVAVLGDMLHDGKEDIVVEMTGMTLVNQAAIRVMLSLCKRHDYTVSMIHLRPANMSDFADTVSGEAAEMFWRALNGGPRWREPMDCPYFPYVQEIEIDHIARLDEAQNDEDAADWYEAQSDRRAVENGTF